MFSRRTITSPVGKATRPRHVSAWLAPLAVITVGVVVLAPAVSADAAQTPVGLGTAGSFAVLAGAGITNTGPDHGQRATSARSRRRRRPAPRR